MLNNERIEIKRAHTDNTITRYFTNGVAQVNRASFNNVDYDKILCWYLSSNVSYGGSLSSRFDGDGVNVVLHNFGNGTTNFQIWCIVRISE